MMGIELKRSKDQWDSWEVSEESLEEVRNAILPCPFCGEKYHIHYETPCNGNHNRYVWTVYHNCGMVDVECRYEGEFAHTELIEDLNRRA
jgi:hypothetical protein